MGFYTVLNIDSWRLWKAALHETSRRVSIPKFILINGGYGKPPYEKQLVGWDSILRVILIYKWRLWNVALNKTGQRVGFYLAFHIDSWQLWKTALHTV